MAYGSGRGAVPHHKRVPRGFAKDHPLTEDLKRKDFIAIHELRLADALGTQFPDVAAARFRDAAGFVRFLCESMDVPF